MNPLIYALQLEVKSLRRFYAMDLIVFSLKPELLPIML